MSTSENLDSAKPQSSVFTDYAHYYDLLYQDKDYAAEAEYVANLIRKFHPSAKTILELGSGTGIHANLLAEKGFAIHGIERSQEMLARSRALAEKMPSERDQLTFSSGDIRNIRLNKGFDAVIALFHVISYQTTNVDVSAAFETARKHLSPGGIFIFDVWYGPAVLTEKPSVKIKRMEDEQTEVTRIAEPVMKPNENLVEVHYDVFVKDKNSTAVNQIHETHIMRYFFKPEFELLADRTGFYCLHDEEWMSGKSPGNNTWSVCFCLKAT